MRPCPVHIGAHAVAQPLLGREQQRVIPLRDGRIPLIHCSHELALRRVDQVRDAALVRVRGACARQIVLRFVDLVRAQDVIRLRAEIVDARAPVAGPA